MPSRILSVNPLLRQVLLGAVLLGLVACAETPTRPSAPALAKGPADPAALEAQINGLIGALFAARDQGAVKKEFARIKNAVARGDDAEAQAGIVAFVRELLEAREDGVLQDPTGAAPPSLGDALLTRRSVGDPTPPASWGVAWHRPPQRRSQWLEVWPSARSTRTAATTSWPIRAG